MSRDGELDRLARAYLRAQDPSLAETLLQELAFDRTLPLLKKIVASKLGPFPDTTQDVDDVCGEAMLALLGKLEEWRSGRQEPESSFDGYVAVTAYHACDEYFRHRFPQRHRLKNRLRYLLKPERGFDLWRSELGEWVCGRVGWRTRHTRVCRVAELEPTFYSLSAAPEQFLRVLFDRMGAPVEFDEVVTLAARAWGITDQQVSLDTVGLTAAKGGDSEPWRIHVRRAWEEILALPLAQRTALLLNLRGESEAAAVALFPLTGVATITDIANALEIPALEFAELWNRLPLGDAEIAGRLSLTRQQVINLRLSARRRLERRMSVAISGVNRRL